MESKLRYLIAWLRRSFFRSLSDDVECVDVGAHHVFEHTVDELMPLQDA